MSKSLVKAQIIPPHAQEAGITRCFIYTGSSMKPTFRSGHLLYVRPTAQELAVGDVIVFTDPLKKDHIVHRIVSITNTRLITRGDNNLHDDLVPVRLEEVVGKVEMTEDRGVLRPVIGGRLRLWMIKVRWAARQLVNWIKGIFRRPYQLLRLSGYVARVWRPSIVKVYLQNESGPLVKYINKQRTVAVWHPLQQRFECRKPYDLIIPPPGGVVH